MATSDAPAKIDVQGLRQVEDPDGNERVALAVGDQGPQHTVLIKTRSALIDPVGYVGEFDPERISMKQMRQMRRDPTIAIGLHVAKSMIVNAPWRIESGDMRLAAFLDGVLRPHMDRLAWQFLLSFDFGRTPIVVSYKREVPGWHYTDEKGEEKPVWDHPEIPAVTIESTRALDPDGAEPKFKADKKTYDGFEHKLIPKSEGSSDNYRVGPEHSLWAVNGFDETFEDWFGFPRTGHSIRAWWSYWYRRLLADRHFEQDADPPLIVGYPPGMSPHPSDPTRTITNGELALIIGDSVRSGATVAKPTEVYLDHEEKPTSTAKWTLEFLKGGENLGAFETSFEQLDREKLRGLLIAEDAVFGESTKPETYAEMFLETQGTVVAAIDRLVTDGLLPILAEQNFVKPARAYRVTQGFRDADKRLMLDLFKIIIAKENEHRRVGIDTRSIAKTLDVPLTEPEEMPIPGQLLPGDPNDPNANQPTRKPGKPKGPTEGTGGPGTGGRATGQPVPRGPNTGRSKRSSEPGTGAGR